MMRSRRSNRAVGILDRLRSTPLPFLQLAFPSINTIQASRYFVHLPVLPLSSSCFFSFSPHLLLPSTLSPTSTNPTLFVPNYFNRLNRLLFITAHHVVRGAFLSSPCPPQREIEWCSYSFSFLVESSATSTTWSSGTASSSLTLCSMVRLNNVFLSSRVGNRC